MIIIFRHNGKKIIVFNSVHVFRDKVVTVFYSGAKTAGDEELYIYTLAVKSIR